MKQLVTFLAAVIIAFSCQAQQEHLKFMGIPLAGSINDFQTKLAAKGIHHNTKLSKSLPVGVRAFKGIFASHEAEVYVFYDKDTKFVYRAKACISRDSKDGINQVYDELKTMLEYKYEDYEQTLDTQNDHECLLVETDTGVIGLYVSQDFGIIGFQYNVHVDYYDSSNSAKHLGNMMDDL